jgi:hypothetical protein
VMQLLAALGLPYVSVEALRSKDFAWQIPGPGWKHRPRLEDGMLVLARALWVIEAEAWQEWRNAGTTAGFFQLRRAWRDAGVPRRFFARFAGAKPQYFDADSAVLLLLFVKMLKAGEGALYITELLPAPGEYAEEIVLELETGRY